MQTSFSFTSTPQIHFGVGKFKLLPRLINNYGKNVLILTGAKSFTSSVNWDILRESLDDLEISFAHFEIPNEPSPNQIDHCVKQFRENDLRVILAIGGGSVLDAGKAVSAMIPLNKPVKNYLEGVGTGESHPGIKIPFIAVPTTSGTGSETTKNAVITEVGKNGFKKSLRHDNFVPDLAVVDPSLTLSTPKNQTAHSGMDAFTQLVESYLSTKSNLMTDSLAIKALNQLKDGLPLAVNEGANIEGRTKMAYASMISGITLANAGLGTIHGFASSVGGKCNIPHGLICGSLMGIVNRITVRELRKQDATNLALSKYARLGRMFSQKDDKGKDYQIDFLLDQIDQWIEEFEIAKLSRFNLEEQLIPSIIKETGNKNNPYQLNPAELDEALRNRI
ncbi:iron-containing alcohol dehydrogenase [Flexithrix dorotheae]|uniref:iron-containing alcohol dehydrogenase n=1 Tax=Flexithrix dorotheae TaxID=70993 RepID=UPI0003786A4F|nr:iron-containing alcohol dehydrogenase [Flexithrix dorotheae]